MTARDPSNDPNECAAGAAGTNVRKRRVRLGIRAEWLAEAMLWLSAHRVLARRYRTPVGEIDLVAVRGRRVAFVEVKRRDSFAACEASITTKARGRVRRAAGLWLARHPAYADFDVGFDVIFVVPMRWPRWLRDGL